MPVIRAAIGSPIDWLRRGGAVLHLQQMPPRLGGPFSGHVSFSRGVTAGDGFKVVLSCLAKSGDAAAASRHKAQQLGRVSDVGGQRRLGFHLKTPQRLDGFERDAETSWQLELYPEGSLVPAFRFPFKMQPPSGVEQPPREALRAGQPGEPGSGAALAPAGPRQALPKGLEGIAALVGKERLAQRLGQMPASRRAELQAHLERLTPGQRQALAKVGHLATYKSAIRKLALWAIALFVAVQVLGVVSTVLFSN